MDICLLRKLNEYRTARRPVIVATHIESGSQQLIHLGNGNNDNTENAPFSACFVQMEPFERQEFAQIHAQAMTCFQSGKSQMVESDAGKIFLNVHMPPPRLIIIGAVHISQALSPMAQAVGLEISIIDPRTAFASKDRFPNISLHTKWPEDILPGLEIDPYTAIIAITHDPKIDDKALIYALKYQCFYVGALGSRKTHAKRIERLAKAGISASSIARIDAPIGLDIKAANPAEIAVSILAAIIAALRSKVKHVS